MRCRYNAALPPAAGGARISPAGAARGTALAVLVLNSRALWGPFLEGCRRDAALLAGADPLNRWVEASVLASTEGVEAPRVFWSHRQAAGLEGGTGYVAIQRAAAASGLAYLDQIAHLCVHPEYGPWFSLRALLVFDDVPFLQPQPPPLPDPTSSEAKARAAAALAAAQGGAAAATHRDVREDWERWLAVREALAPRHPWRYPQDQLLYHYTADRALLDAAVAAREEGP